MTGNSHSHGAKPTPDELRAQVEETRRELGETVEALAARADVRAQARQKATQLKGQATEKAHTMGDRIQHRTPQPVRDKAHQAAEMTRAGGGAPLVAGVAVLAVLLAVRSRRH
ncbi:DUF3618 domain-containing protein [Streptomyces diacarni]|uniref:DUF3618 domain-containing protein n=1 Tax=Streptomyces diacarni TaxID=2800381 RepID=A0A367ELF8_9ACTN|nr:DUF3618 domain-containing protein [Streptomyces diacarni]RCG18946.1 DUF3618 domain-containing protein [Streptomyces diacarni]